jgi:hypothetical protein
VMTRDDYIIFGGMAVIGFVVGLAVVLAFR